MLNSILLRTFVLLSALCLCAASASAGIYDDILSAANRDDTGQVVDLLKRGMDVNTADQSGNTLLMIAARNNNVSLLDFLLRNRANILKKNEYGDSALMLASLRGNREAVRMLLDALAPADSAGWNSIHYAAYSGKVDILRMLVSSGSPNLDVAAPNGQTALMLAARNGHLDAVRVLVDADADIDLEDYDGQTALSLAQDAGFTDVADYLRDVGAVE
jgi:hypothetical protein